MTSETENGASTFDHGDNRGSSSSPSIFLPPGKMKSISLLSLLCVRVLSFSAPPLLNGNGYWLSNPMVRIPSVRTTVTSQLRSSGKNGESSENRTPLSESDQLVLGVVGTLAASVVFVSEYVLKTTGCGLPAGPLGVFGLAEGLSYLGIIGVGGYSAFTKFKTGSGLPAGPFGLLGVAEGLSFLAIAAGLVVLVLQVTNYGYIPNAVPMEGGMCS